MHPQPPTPASAERNGQFHVIAELGISYVASTSQYDSPRPYFVKRWGSHFITFLKNPAQRALAWLSLEDGYFRWLRQHDTALFHASAVDCDDAGNISILSENQKTLSLLDPFGRLQHQQRLTLPGRPISLQCGDDQSWLIGTWKPGGVYLIDSRGRVLWKFAPPASVLLEARSVFLSATGSCCIADAGLHRVLVVNHSGQIVSQYGVAGSPGAGPHRLSNPSMIEPCPDGAWLICDTRNNRVLKINAQTDLVWEWPPRGGVPSAPTQLWMPWCVRCLPDGGLLVADTHNSRLLRLSKTLELVRSYGSTPVRERLLCFPRSVEPLRSGRYLVADTYNNRVVELDRRSRICWSFGGEPGDGPGALFWPRRALRLADQSTLIADSRNDRLLVVNTGGKVERVISTVRMENGPSPLHDPHDIISASNGHLFIADTGNHRLVEVDRVGRCVWLSSGPSSKRFDDLHHVSVGTNGELLISDTGNDRIVICNLHSKAVTDMQLLSTGKDDWIALKQPRACYFRYGHYWILDSGNSRIVIADRQGRVVWSPTITLENSPLPRVTCPRWLSILSPDRILVSDYFESRVLLVKISQTWVSERGGRKLSFVDP